MGATLVVDADYECYPLWIRSEEGFRNVHPNELGLSVDLVERLLSWADELEASMNMDDPLSSDFSSQAAYEIWVRRGRQLAEEIAKQVDGDWKVVYVDFIARKEVDINVNAS